MRGAVVLGLLGACGGGPDPAPDAATPVGESGLTFAWHAALPGPVSAAIAVTRASLEVRGFHMIGDAGDTSTLAPLALEWSASAQPAASMIADALPGLYSKLAFKVDGDADGDAYEIEGTYGATPFRIHDHSAAVSVSLDASASLAPGGSARVALELDLAAALGGIDFASLRDEDGTLELDTGDDQIAGFRARLATAFAIP